MNKVTAIIIAKNEEMMIGQALESLEFCDEVIIIDSGSKDKTKDIANKYKATVYELKTNDFSELRNLGLRKASNEWILYIDADERVDEDLKKSIKYTVSKDSDFTAFKIYRKNYYFGNHEWPYVEKIERFFKKEMLKEWTGQLHESPIVIGKIGQLDGLILHFTHRDLESMVNKTIEWSSVEALLRYNAAHPKMSWWRFPRVMITSFLNSYIKQKGYKAGAVGLVESLYQSFSMFITYAKLWELQNNNITEKKYKS